MVSLVLGVSHTPWIPERAASMARLRQRLGVGQYAADLVEGRSIGMGDRSFYFEATDRAHVSVWSERMWRRALGLSVYQGVPAGHCAFTQDDCVVAPDFWAILRAIVAVVPDQLLGLHLHHPGAVMAHRDGERFITTVSCVGTGYVLPAPLLAEFLAWRSRQSAETLYRTTEDNLLDAWAIHTRRRVWHPVPTIVRPDPTLGSTGGGAGRDDADNQYMRATVLDWQGFRPEDLTSEAWWRAGLRQPPRHLVFAGIARPGVSIPDHPAGFDGQLRARMPS